MKWQILIKMYTMIIHYKEKFVMCGLELTKLLKIKRLFKKRV